MKYSVQWERRALDALAQIWVDHSAQRTAINQAVATTDQSLQITPETQRESRDRGRRIVFFPPLVVIYRVDTSRRLVHVINVRYAKRRGTN